MSSLPGPSHSSQPALQEDGAVASPRACSERSLATAFPGGPSLCSGPSPLPGPFVICSCSDKCAQDARGPKPPRSSGVSCTLGSTCLVEENALGLWEGDMAKGLGAPDRWNGSSVVWEHTRPSTPKTPKALEAVSDTSEAEVSLTGPSAEAGHFHIQGGAGFPAARWVP